MAAEDEARREAELTAQREAEAMRFQGNLAKGILQGVGLFVDQLRVPAPTTAPAAAGLGSATAAVAGAGAAAGTSLVKHAVPVRLLQVRKP